MDEKSKTMRDTEPAPPPMLAALHGAVEDLNWDELSVVLKVAERVKSGRAEYGPLSLDNDRREFVLTDVSEELIDSLAYLAMQIERIRRLVQSTPLEVLKHFRADARRRCVAAGGLCTSEVKAYDELITVLKRELIESTREGCG